MSPLRYPGSKRGLIDYIKEALEINAVEPALYVEPFVGGGSVAINLLHENLVNQAILVDLDPWITSFWQTVFFDSDWLINQVQNIDVTLENWNIYKHSNPADIREQAITCLFLNRTSFSGILEERVGPLGGRDQKSNYPIDCRFTPKTRETIIDRIEQIARLKDRIYGIWNCTWNDAIDRIRVEQKQYKLPNENLFFYMDPPFFEEADSLYRFYFLDEDHKNLRDLLINLHDKWILSYDSAEQVEALYGDAIRKATNGTHHHHIELLYSLAGVAKRKNGKEVIISNLGQLPTLNSSYSKEKNEENVHVECESHIK
ncbi:MAG: DNA adenine methylase [Anaerolineaceae bacterium]|nr:DNA adenine methylase [Anaerolineaceae bacterium]